MSTAPIMPLFPDAYLADTTHLTTEEHGAYLLLLMAMWRRSGKVPNDDADLARIVGLSRLKMAKNQSASAPPVVGRRRRAHAKEAQERMGACGRKT